LRRNRRRRPSPPFSPPFPPFFQPFSPLRTGAGEENGDHLSSFPLFSQFSSSLWWRESSLFRFYEQAAPTILFFSSSLFLLLSGVADGKQPVVQLSLPPFFFFSFPISFFCPAPADRIKPWEPATACLSAFPLFFLSFSEPVIERLKQLVKHRYAPLWQVFFLLFRASTRTASRAVFFPLAFPSRVRARNRKESVRADFTLLPSFFFLRFPSTVKGKVRRPNKTSCLLPPLSFFQLLPRAAEDRSGAAASFLSFLAPSYFVTTYPASNGRKKSAGPATRPPSLPFFLKAFPLSIPAGEEETIHRVFLFFSPPSTKSRVSGTTVSPVPPFFFFFCLFLPPLCLFLGPTTSTCNGTHYDDPDVPLSLLFFSKFLARVSNKPAERIGMARPFPSLFFPIPPPSERGHRTGRRRLPLPPLFSSPPLASNEPRQTFPCGHQPINGAWISTADSFFFFPFSARSLFFFPPLLAQWKHD